MKRIIAVALALGFMGALATGPASAQEKVTPEDIKICLETIKEMTGGKASDKAKGLCEKGKLNEAIDAAMGG